MSDSFLTRWTKVIQGFDPCGFDTPKVTYPQGAPTMTDEMKKALEEMRENCAQLAERFIKEVYESDVAANDLAQTIRGVPLLALSRPLSDVMMNISEEFLEPEDLIAKRSALSTGGMSRDDVIEECAKVADAERATALKEREECRLLNLPQETIVHGREAIIAKAIANGIRAMLAASPSPVASSEDGKIQRNIDGGGFLRRVESSDT